MPYRLLADAVVLLHLAFVAFVVGGGLLVLWRRWMAAVHLPAAASRPPGPTALLLYKTGATHRASVLSLSIDLAT